MSTVELAELDRLVRRDRQLRQQRVARPVEMEDVALAPAQQRAILMGLLISGGMLIPGNIPNIVAANRLGISSREWARVGLIAGLPLMAVCFAFIQWIG